TGDYAAPTSFKVFTPVVLNPPTPTNPPDGATLSTLLPKFTVTNSTHTGPVTSVSYVLEIATDITFGNKVVAVDYPESAGGTTSATLSTPLAGNTRFYWHIKATSPGFESGWSATLSFVTPAPAPTPAPTPTPPPSGGVGSGDQIDLRTVTIVLGAPNI